MSKSESRNVPICMICRNEEKDSRKLLNCVSCHKSAHFKCKNITGSTVRKHRDQPFFCSVQCKEVSHRQTENSTMDGQVLEEVRKVLAEVQETRTEILAMKNTIREIEKFQNFLSGQLDTVVEQMKAMKTDHSELNSKVMDLRSKQQSTSETVEQLELDVDRIKRSTLSKNAVIIGVPMLKNESTVRIVDQISKVLGYELPDGAIVVAERIITKDQQQNTTKTPPIKVVFVDEKFKEELFAKKKNHGSLLLSAVDPAFRNGSGKVMLRDELTPYGINLLKEVRQVQDQLDLKYVWPGRNGAILVKKSDNSKVEIIRKRSEVELLQRKKRQLSASPTAPTAKR